MNNLNKFKRLKDIEQEYNISVDRLLTLWREYKIYLYINFENEAGYLKQHYPFDSSMDEKYYSPNDPPQLFGIENIRKFKYNDKKDPDKLNDHSIEGYASGFWIILPPNNKEHPTFFLNRFMELGHYYSEYQHVCQIFAIKDEQDLIEQTCLMGVKNRTDRMNYNFQLRDRVIIKNNELYVNLTSIELFPKSIISKKQSNHAPSPNTFNIFYTPNLLNECNTNITLYEDNTNNSLNKYNINNTLNEYNIYNNSNSLNNSDNTNPLEETNISQEVNCKNTPLSIQEITIESLNYFLKSHYLNKSNSNLKVIADDLNTHYNKITGKKVKITEKTVKQWVEKEKPKRNSRLISIALYILIYKHCTKKIETNEIFENLPKVLKAKLNINKNIIKTWIIKFKDYDLI